eukprot:Clim_evm7s212 gene=Clim_evmTU7s212
MTETEGGVNNVKSETEIKAHILELEDELHRYRQALSKLVLEHKRLIRGVHERNSRTPPPSSPIGTPRKFKIGGSGASSGSGRQKAQHVGDLRAKRRTDRQLMRAMKQTIYALETEVDGLTDEQDALNARIRELELQLSISPRKSAEVQQNHRKESKGGVDGATKAPKNQSTVISRTFSTVVNQLELELAEREALHAEMARLRMGDANVGTEEELDDEDPVELAAGDPETAGKEQQLQKQQQAKRLSNASSVSISDDPSASKRDTPFTSTSTGAADLVPEVGIITSADGYTPDQDITAMQAIDDTTLLLEALHHARHEMRLLREKHDRRERRMQRMLEKERERADMLSQHLGSAALGLPLHAVDHDDAEIQLDGEQLELSQQSVPGLPDEMRKIRLKKIAVERAEVEGSSLNRQLVMQLLRQKGKHAVKNVHWYSMSRKKKSHPTDQDGYDGDHDHERHEEDHHPEAYALIHFDMAPDMDPALVGRNGASGESQPNSGLQQVCKICNADVNSAIGHVRELMLSLDRKDLREQDKAVIRVALSRLLGLHEDDDKAKALLKKF